MALGLEQRRRLTLAATIIGSSLAFIDATVVIVALPTIEQDLGLGLSGQQWVFLSYSLALASLYLAGGAIGDRYGRRRTFVAGAAAFALASLLAGAAPNEEVLLLARTLQGIAGAFLTTNSLALLRATYGDEAGRAVGLWTAWTSVATIAGPPAGGALVEWVSWRWIFLINLPLAALAVLAAHYGKCDETAQQRLGRLDVPGAVLAALGFGALTYGLVEGAERGFPEVWWAFVVGVVALVAFVVAERRTSQPMLPFELFKRRNFAAANLETFLVYAALYGVFLYLTLYIQFLGFTPFEAGLIQIPTSIVMIALAARFGAIADRQGPRMLLTVGPALIGVGALLFLLVSDRSDFWIWGIGGLLVFSFGLAMMVAPITSTALKSVSSDFAGIASAVNNSVSRIGSLCSVAIIGLVVQRVFERNGGTGTPLEPTSPAVDHAANVDAFRAGMLVAAVLAFAGAAVGAAWISNREARDTAEPVSEPAPVPAGGS
jgi:EmrB/QacA subfamily drug resistance transporter